MPDLGKAFTITGVANTTTYDTVGLVSPSTEKRHCDSITINLTGHIGNKIEVWLDREKLIEVYDYSLDTSEASGAANAYKSSVKPNVIPIDRDIPIGSKLQVAINCGATLKSVYGTYNYKVVG